MKISIILSIFFFISSAYPQQINFHNKIIDGKITTYYVELNVSDNSFPIEIEEYLIRQLITGIEIPSEKKEKEWLSKIDHITTIIQQYINLGERLKYDPIYYYITATNDWLEENYYQ